jgi:hypothetical protein
MRIDLSAVDTEQFMVHPHLLNGEVVHLIQPQHIGIKWQKNTMIFRSSVWSNDGVLISASFPKFFNWGEQTELSPTPDSLNKCVCVEKLDGSTLIVSKWKGNFILRTRETIDAHKLDNGYELEIFEKTILEPFVKSIEDKGESWDFSLLFEWLSPVNRMVIRIEEPQFKLIGCVLHLNYTLFDQDKLDRYAKMFGWSRPETYSFDSIANLIELVKKWEGKKGVVIYSNKGQTLHKVKSD